MAAADAGLMQTKKLLAGLLLLSFLGLFFNRLFQKSERWIVPWKQ
jgi:ABC-type nitrate/sulfonate/bicarbonate transport system permease component